MWAAPTAAVVVLLAELLTGVSLIAALTSGCADSRSRAVHGFCRGDGGEHPARTNFARLRMLSVGGTAAGMATGHAKCRVRGRSGASRVNSSLGLAEPARWMHALPAGVALFVIYIALNAVWALDASRVAAFTRS